MISISGISIRRALAADAPVLAEMRVRAQAERNGTAAADLVTFRATCAETFGRALCEPWLRAWLAYEGLQAVGTATLTLAPTLPRLDGGRRKAQSRAWVDGRVRNVYVDPAFRRRGIARALMEALLNEADREGVDRLALGSSELGRPLYELLGFVAKDDEMIYRRSPRSAMSLR